MSYSNLLSLFAGLFLSFSSYAAPETGAGNVCDLSKAKTEVEFLAIGNPSALKIRGKAKEVSDKKPIQGTFTLKDTSLIGKVKCTLDSFDTGIEMRNRHMKEKYLETAKFPEAVFNLTELSLPAGVEGKAKSLSFKGELTLHGVTKPVSGTADVEKKSGHLNAAFEFKLKPSDYGIVSPTFMGITMADEVTVDVNVDGPVS